MRSGTWNGPVSTDNVRVTVNGTVRPVSKVVIQSGMRDGHPASDVGESWCVESTIDWVAPPLVFSGAPHHFGGGATDWLPKAGDSVVIETGDGELGKWWVQHRGVIDDTTGSFADGTAQSTTVDRVEDLDGNVHFGALTQAMYPSAASGTNYRYIGLQSTFLIDRMLRNVQGDTGQGWWATPQRTWQTVLSVPNMGSTWPEVGSLAKTSQIISGPAWSKTDYGVAPRNWTGTYTITPIPEVIISCAIIGGGSFEGLVEAYQQSSSGAFECSCFLGFDPATNEIVYGIRSPGGTVKYRLARGPATRASVYFRRNTMSSQTIILRTDDGREVTRNTSSGQFPVGWAANTVTVGHQTGLGWVIVEGEKPANQRWFTLEAPTNARIRVGDMPWWRATRDLPYENVAEWLQGQVDAECAAAWLDEDGNFQWAGRGVLEGQSVVNTITSVRDVDDIQWESRRSALARSVWVQYLEANIRNSTAGAIWNVWDTDSVDLGRGEEEEIIVSVPGDEDWVGLDTNSDAITRYTEPRHLRNGSKHGGTLYEDVNHEPGQTWASFLTCTMTRVGLRAVKVYLQSWSTNPVGHRIKTAIPDLRDLGTSYTNLSPWHSGNPAVRLRTNTLVKWIDGERSLNAGTVGPARYTHDVGWRVQSVGDYDGVGELMSWLRTQVMATTRPRVTGLTIEHDPRHQIGDKLRVQETAITGVDYDQLIQQRTVTISATEFSETISGRSTVVRLDIPNGPLNTDWTSRHEPGGPTPITPSSDWTREAVE